MFRDLRLPVSPSFPVSEETENADHEEHDCDRTKSNHHGAEHRSSVGSLVPLHHLSHKKSVKGQGFSEPTIRSRVGALAYIEQVQSNESHQPRLAARPTTPGFTAIGVFLFFGAVVASLAATTLLWRGTVLDRVWNLNPSAYKQLVPLGGTFGILFVLLGAALTTAGIGWVRRRLWGWRLAVIIIATQVLGDVVNCVRGDWLRGGIGVIIAGA